MIETPPPVSPAPLPVAEARRRYLRYVAVRLAGISVMVLGLWLGRSHGQAIGLPVVLAGGATLFIRPRHLGLTRK
jgi:hypothetical protein